MVNNPLLSMSHPGWLMGILISSWANYSDLSPAGWSLQMMVKSKGSVPKIPETIQV